MDPRTLLMIVAVIAVIIVLVTVTAVFIILRKPESATNQRRASASTANEPETATNGSAIAETIPTHTTEDIEAYLAEQQANLSPFELPDVSNSFKGTTQDRQRTGIILHVSDPETGLIGFTSNAFNDQNGVVNAETTYGKMELIITQGRAGIKWEGEPLGILDYSNERILGPEGQLLGSMERPKGGPAESDYYPIGFFGQKAGEVVTKINPLSTLRWFGNEGEDQLHAFQGLADNLEDNQTLLLLGALLLEIGFMDLIS